MRHQRVTLSRQVRKYFAEIGKRGGRASRRELTRQQAKLMIAIREAKRAAAAKGLPAPKLSRKHRLVLQKPTH
jgi:hypothetical protein